MDGHYHTGTDRDIQVQTRTYMGRQRQRQGQTWTDRDRHGRTGTRRDRQGRTGKGTNYQGDKQEQIKQGQSGIIRKLAGLKQRQASRNIIWIQQPIEGTNHQRKTVTNQATTKRGQPKIIKDFWFPYFAHEHPCFVPACPCFVPAVPVLSLMSLFCPCCPWFVPACPFYAL